ncbi:serpin-ZX-like isoform X2 [Rosa rugosa]|uniref:serpin-ZX-like isoform X2 n=1 Tax=Rosa rugosa TaxID=74645 RepID=UPI002B413C5C|nr:serpin-ZX-like isoform X2 [Rosa rugosa]
MALNSFSASGYSSFHIPVNPQSDTESSTTITISEPSSSNGRSSQPGFGTTSSPTLGTITINPSSGTSITITPTSATTITITSSSASTTVTIAPTSGTTSTSTSGHTPFPSPFAVPSQVSQPFETSTSTFNRINNFDQTEPGNRGGFGPSLFKRSQNSSGIWFGSACPATNPFGMLPERPPQLSFGHSAPSPSVQDGILGSLTATMEESIENQTDVALRITKKLLLTKGKDKNMVYSPLSIHVVLSLIAAGSKKGYPQDEMLKFLKAKSTEQLNDLALKLIPLVFADGSPSGGPCLSLANGVWVEMSLPVMASFKQVVENAYKAVLKQVDFMTKSEEARCEVNSWAEKETRGLIKDLLPPGTVDSTTRIILANALYFKGAWDQKFNETRTKMFDFHLLSGRSVKAPFMTSWKDQFISVFDGFKVLKLPYKQGEDHNRRFSMYVFLPNASNGLPSLVERVCSEAGFLGRYLPWTKVEVNKFLIPKFKITFGFEACQFLETLGLKLPYLSETVVGDEPVVELMIHKSFIEVNEEGTEAAAATAAVGFGYCSASRPVIEKIDFVADHPFLFLIREEATGAVMFIGHVLNPVAD